MHPLRRARRRPQGLEHHSCIAETAARPDYNLSPMSPLLRTRAVEVATERLTLSGLLAEPDGRTCSCSVALHGHGMTARYFSGPANPDLSLLELGAALGFTVWAPDRPGYGTSVDADPASFAMFTQADILNDAIHRFTGSHAIGAGCFLIGHSFGLKIALTMAASATRPASLMGVDGSGSGLSYTFQPGVTRPSRPRRPQRILGPQAPLSCDNVHLRGAPRRPHRTNPRRRGQQLAGRLPPFRHPKSLSP